MMLLPFLSVLLLCASVHSMELRTQDSDDSLRPLDRVKRQFGGFQGGFNQHHRIHPNQRRPGVSQQGGFFPQNHGHGHQHVGFPQHQGFQGAVGVQPQSVQQFGVHHKQTYVRGPTGYVPANQGNSPNCRGNRKRLPECQGGNQQGGSLSGLSSNEGQIPPGQQGKAPNCRGHRRNRPECNVNTEPVTDEKVIEAFNNVQWLSTLSPDNRSLGIPNLPDTPSAQAQSRNFLLGVGQPDVPFQSCSTPRFEPGHCRYLQHCIQPEFVNNFNVFLRYVCFINGAYVGVCCPDSRYNIRPTPSTTTTTTTTPRPTTPRFDTVGCGLSAKEQTRIVGGRQADPQEWPWMAALLRDGNTQFCGGVLITNRHVLTAAHCVVGFDTSTVSVRLGEYTFDETTDSSHHDYTPLEIRPHLQYNTTTYVNDIAIVILPGEVAFNSDIWPVCLPPFGDIYTGEEGTVTGWGTIYYGGPIAKTLQEVTIPIWDNKDCDDTYEQTIVDTVLCAGATTGGKDSCQGDSGGPLLLRSRTNGRWMVIGVVSWGIRCAEPGFPGVYTRVNRYLDWIRANAL